MGSADEYMGTMAVKELKKRVLRAVRVRQIAQKSSRKLALADARKRFGPQLD